MSDPVSVANVEKKRIPATRAPAKTETSSLKMTNEQIAQELEEKEKFKSRLNDMEVEVVRLKFDNEILLNKLFKEMENQKEAEINRHIKNMVMNTNEIDIFYNTKNNYVDTLQKKIVQKDEALRTFKYHEYMEDQLKLKYQLADLKTDYRNLAKKYITLKSEKKILMKFKKNYNYVLPRAKLMRGLLKKYSETSKLSNLELQVLALDEKDMLLDERTDANAAMFVDDLNDSQEKDPEELKMSYVKHKQSVSMLTGELKSLTRTLETERTSTSIKIREVQMVASVELEKFKADQAKLVAELKEKHIGEVNALNMKIAQLENGAFRANAANEDFTKERESLKAEVERARKEYEKKIQVVENNAQIYQTKVREVENRLETSEKKSETFEKKVIVTEKKAETAEKKAETYEKKAEASEKKVQEVMRQITETQRVVTKQKTEVQQRIEENTLLQETITRYEVKIEEITREREELITKTTTTTTTRHMVKKNPLDKSILEEVSSDSQQVEIDRKLIEDLEAQRDALRKELDDLMGRFNELTDLYQASSSKITTLEASETANGKLVDDIKIENAKLKALINQLNQDSVGKVKEIETLKRQIDDKDHHRAATEKKLEDLENLKTGLQYDKSSLGGKLIELKSQKSLLEQQKTEMERIRGELEIQIGNITTDKQAKVEMANNPVLSESLLQMTPEIRMAEIQERYFSLSTKGVELTTEVNKLTAEKEMLIVTHSNLEEVVLRQDNTIQGLQKETKDLLAKLEAERTDKAHLKDEIERKNQALEMLKNTQKPQAMKDSKLEEAKDRVYQLELEKAQLEQALELKDFTITASLTEINNLRTEITSTQRRVMETKTKYKERLAEAEGLKMKSPEELALLQSQHNDRESALKHLRGEALSKNQELRLKNDEIVKLKSKLDELETEVETLNKQIASFQQLKEALDNLSKSQLDNLDYKQKNEELTGQMTKFKEETISAKKEAEIMREKYEEYFNAVVTKDNEIERLTNANRDLYLEKCYFSSIETLQEQKTADLLRIVMRLESEVEREKKEKSVYVKEMAQLRETFANKRYFEPKDAVTVRVVEKEKEQLIERITILEKEIRRHVDIIREKEIFIQTIIIEAKETRESTEGYEDLRERLRERNLQIMDIIADSNYKTDVIELLEGRLMQYETEIAETSRRLALSEEKMKYLLSQSKKAPQSSELLRYRVKYDVPEPVYNTPDELFILFRLVDDKKQELDYIKKQMDMLSDNDSPLLRKYQSETETMKYELKLREETIAKSSEKLQEHIVFTNKLESQIRDLVERLEHKNNEMFRLQGTIAELTYNNNQMLKDEAERKPEFNSIKGLMKVREQELRSVFDTINELKLEIHNMEVEKRIMQEKIISYSTELRDKEQELAMLQEENYELQNNLINGTEDFIEKLGEKDAEIKEYIEQLEKKTDDVSRVNKERLDAENHINSLMEENKELFGRVTVLEKTADRSKRFVNKDLEPDDHAERAKELELTLCEKKQKLAELEGQIMRLVNRQDAEVDIHNKESMLMPLHDEITRHKAMFATLKQMKDTGDDTEIYKERLQVLRKKIDFLEKENSALKSHLDQLMHKAKAQEEEFKLKDFFTRDPNTSINLKIDLADKARKIDSLNKTIVMKNTDYHTLKEYGQQVDTKLSKAESEKKELKLELELTQHTLFALQQKVEIAELVKAEGNIDEQNRRFLTLMDQKDKYFNQIIRLKNQEFEKLEPLANLLIKKESEIKALREDAAKVIKDLKYCEIKFSVAKEHAVIVEQKAHSFEEMFTKQEALLAEQAEKLVSRENVYLTDHVRALTDELHETRMKKEDLELIVEKRDGEIRELKARLDNYENFWESSRIDSDELKEVILQKDAEIKRLRSTIDSQKDFEVFINSQKQQLLNSRLKIQEMEKVLDKRNSQIEELQSETQAQKLDIIELQSNLNLLERGLEKANKALGIQNDAIEQLTGSNRALTNQIEKLLQDIDSLEAQNYELQRELTAEVNELQQLLAEKVKEFNQGVALNTSKLSQITGSMRDKESEKRALGAKIKELQADKEDLMMVVHNYKVDEMNRIKEVKVLDDKLKLAQTDSNREKFELYDEYHKLLDKVDALNTDKEKAAEVEEKNKELKEHVNILMAEITKQKISNRELNEDIVKLKVELSEVKKNYRQMDGSVLQQSKVDEKVRSLENQIIKIQTENNELMKNNSALRLKYKALTDSLNDEVTENNKQAKQIHEIEREMEEIQASAYQTLNDLMRIVDELKAEHNRYDN